MDKTLLVVIDEFDDRVLSYDQVTLYDYGTLQLKSYIDNYYDIYTGSYSGYGNYDDILISVPDPTGGFYQLTSDNDDTFTKDIDFDLVSYGNSFTDVLGYTAFYDDAIVFDRLHQSDGVHGNYVVEAIYQTLNDPSKTELLCIDVDTLNGYDAHLTKLFEHKNFSVNNDIYYASSLEHVIYDFLINYDKSFNSNSPNTYDLVGLSYSISGAKPDINEANTLELLAEFNIPVFQAAPNVGRGDYDWGTVYEDVINVGAWNQDSSKNLLVSSINTLHTLDILADGYIDHPQLGPNFGTSFATPRAAA